MIEDPVGPYSIRVRPSTRRLVERMLRVHVKARIGLKPPDGYARSACGRLVFLPIHLKRFVSFMLSAEPQPFFVVHDNDKVYYTPNSLFPTEGRN